MDRNAERILDQAGIVARLLEAVPGAHLADGAASDGLVRAASDAVLLSGIEELSQLIRLAEAERVKFAGEVARRSPKHDSGSLAKRMGCVNAVALVAQRAGLPRAEAVPVVKLGEAIRVREALSGEPLPPLRPHIAAAVADSAIGMAVAAAIHRTLHKVTRSLSTAKLLELEEQLVVEAQGGWSPDEFLAYLRLVPNAVDPDHAGDRERALKKLAQVVERNLESGLTRFILDLDPLTAALFKRALEANSAIRRHGFLDTEPETDDTISEADAAREQRDTRPLHHRRVDAIAEMARKALGVDDGDLAGDSVTVIVTMTEEALKTGIGTATLAGCDEPISAATARMLAASAEIIPVVLGGKSQPLDLGLSRRYFSRAQRRAMLVRDGHGCNGPASTAPNSWLEAAHITPAGYGPTNLDNGVLLCTHCHRLLDLEGWQIERDHNRWWWRPPPWIDPTGKRRPGGTPPLPHLHAA